MPPNEPPGPKPPPAGACVPSHPIRASMNPMLDLSVPAPSGGERLDRFLAGAQPDLSRTRLQSLIRDGHVRVNGRAERASHRLKAGDQIRVEIPAREAPTPLVPEERPLAIAYEDEG